MKNESSINPHNSREIKAAAELSANELIVQYNGKLVLLQIPQDDTRIEVVMQEFKDSNKVIGIFVVLMNHSDP